MAGERLVEMMQRAAQGQVNRSTPTDFIYGTVTSVSPLTVKPDEQQSLGEGFLILSALCRPFTTSALIHAHKADGGTGEETDIQLITVTLWRGLAVGDRVRMLRCRGGQKYYVLDREGSL